ncbi:hypothetical protein QR680_010455 [Steinernema hermaphroditum]|nr:hypothetical protein QR680_010455 [Steinernema hermaphroditum]
MKLLLALLGCLLLASPLFAKPPTWPTGRPYGVRVPKYRSIWKNVPYYYHFFTSSPFPPGRPTSISGRPTTFPYSRSGLWKSYGFPYVYHPIAERLFKSGDTPDNYDFIRLG